MLSIFSSQQWETKPHKWISLGPHIRPCIAVPTKCDFCDCCRNTGQFRFGVERAKRFVNVHLHCIVSNMNRINKMSRLPLLEKSLRTPMSWRGI